MSMSAERDVVDDAGPGGGGGFLAEIFEPVFRGLGAAMGEVEHVGVAEIEPVDRELEVRRRPDLHAEHVHEPVLGLFEVFGLDQKMLQMVKRHGMSPNACSPFDPFE